MLNIHIWIEHVHSYCQMNIFVKKPTQHILSNLPSCALQLITYQSNTTTCQPFRIQLQEVQVTKIINGKWIVTIPSRLVVPILCKNSKDNIPLFGSYLIEASNECQIQIKSLILRTYKTNQLTYKEVSLPELDLSENNYGQKEIIFNPPTLDLNTINLKETKEIQASLEEQRRKIEEITQPISINP